MRRVSHSPYIQLGKLQIDDERKRSAWAASSSSFRQKI
jgi:hypothetical protein